ncbi:hypothetical protein B0H19DRAFT_1063130 [Mycena capillaripes]|nr:hypothetical protein B0H19DRAFT_1063130 [Mycena capillaripes]
MTLKPFDGQGPAYDKLRQNHNASEMISPQLDREPRSASIKENKAREKHGTRVNESAKNNTPASPGVLPSKNSARAQISVRPGVGARVQTSSPSGYCETARWRSVRWLLGLDSILRLVPLQHRREERMRAIATRYARVADNPPTRLMRLRTLRSMSTQAFGSEEEENVYTGAEAGQGKRRAYPCPEVQARGEGRNWEIEGVGTSWAALPVLGGHIVVHKRGGWLVIETGARLQTSGTRSALALANSARGSRIEQNDATPVYGLETTKDEYRAPVGALQCFKRVAMPVQERRYRPARRAEAACRQKSASA